MCIFIFLEEVNNLIIKSHITKLNKLIIVLLLIDIMTYTLNFISIYTISNSHLLLKIILLLYSYQFKNDREQKISYISIWKLQNDQKYLNKYDRNLKNDTANYKYDSPVMPLPHASV